MTDLMNKIVFHSARYGGKWLQRKCVNTMLHSPQSASYIQRRTHFITHQKGKGFRKLPFVFFFFWFSFTVLVIPALLHPGFTAIKASFHIKHSM